MKKSRIFSLLTIFSFALIGCNFSFVVDEIINIDINDSNVDSYHTHSIFDIDNGLTVKTISKKGKIKETSDYTYIVRKTFNEEIDTSIYFPNEGDYEVSIFYKDLFSRSYSINVKEYVSVSGVSFDSSVLEVKERTIQTINYQIFPSNASIKKVRWEIDDLEIAKIDEEDRLTGVSAGETSLTVTTVDGGFTDTIDVNVVSNPQEPSNLSYTYNDLTNNYRYNTDATPNKHAKLLVIPIWFTDSLSYISASKRESVRQDIQTVCFGNEIDTGWHSVASYYYQESFSQCLITGTVSDWYEVSYSSRDIDQTTTSNLVKDATNWYFFNHPIDARTNYDCDNNGYLDGVCLIYGAADYRHDSRRDRNENLWAYCYWLQDSKVKGTNVPNVYFFVSYDFMYGVNNAGIRTGKSYYAGDCSHLILDAHTFIHETGHMFGLRDYYDYGTSSLSPAGGFSMQDSNVGGHDPYSVMALGWAKPYIPTTSMEIVIGAFQTTHEVILLANHEVNSPFDEYLLLELYTPTGLNHLDCLYQYKTSYPRGPSSIGIRLWHIDGRLLRNPWNSIDNITTNPLINNFGTIHAMSNSYSGNDHCSPLGNQYYNYNILQIIRNNTNMTYRPKGNLINSDLFISGESFSMSRYQSQFVNGLNLNDGHPLGWSFSVEIEGSGESAKATITLFK